MAPTTNGRVLFNEVPTGFPEPGKTTIHDTSETIDLENVPLNGGILVKILYLSIDPYMRGKMRKAEKKSYSAPYEIGQPLSNYGVARVLRSEHGSFKAGDNIYGGFKFQQYAVVPEPEKVGCMVIDNKHNLPLSTYIGVLGMPGQTAWVAWKKYSQAKEGEVAFISGGAGPVGATVIQLAKAGGLKVISSAGSDEKVEFLKSVGADVVFNYKKETTQDVLAREGPIDIYWDNVGGETLETAFNNANLYSRFILCGAISDYNSGTPYHNKALHNIFTKTISVNGFIIGHILAPYRDQFYKEMPELVGAGKIKFLEHRVEGLEEAGQGILDNQKGGNVGKSVVVVAKEE